MGFLSVKENKSGSIAKERLKLLLVSERMNYSPGMLHLLKNEMIQAAGKYLTINDNEVSVTYSRSQDTIIAKIPLQQLNLEEEDC